MTDDDLERRLRALRPPTDADHGWAGSDDGERFLARVRQAVAAEGPRRPSIVAGLRSRRTRLGAGLVAAAAVAAVAIVLPGGGDGHRPGDGGDVAFAGPRPVAHTLTTAESCDALLANLRSHAVANPGAYDQWFDLGFPEPLIGTTIDGAAARMETGMAFEGLSRTPTHSGTNNQEIGVDEPDVVKTDGKRIVSITGGTLRITDVASEKVVGSLDLTAYADAESAELLVEGDYALVSMGDRDSNGFALVYGRPVSCHVHDRRPVRRRAPHRVDAAGRRWSGRRPHG
jgi:hypothetical protein